MLATALLGLTLLATDCGEQRPPCEPFTVHGREVVTFMWDDAVTCDVRPPMELNIVFDDSYHEAWGGDASVHAAAADCDDMGGRQVWVQDPYRLICEDVDY